MKNDSEHEASKENLFSFIELMRLKLLFLLFIPIQISVNIILFLLGLGNICASLFISTSNKKIGIIIRFLVKLKVKLLLVTYSYDGSLNHLEIKKEEEISRFSSIYRLSALITFIFIWGVILLDHVFFWLRSLTKSIIGKSIEVPEKSLEDNIEDIVKSIYFLTGLTDKKPKWKSLDDTLLMAFFLIITALSIFFVGLRIGDFSVEFSITYTLVFVTIFAFFIPEFIESRKTFPKGIREEFGLTKPRSKIKDILVAIGIVAIELLIIYGIQLAIENDSKNWYVDSLGFKYYLAFSIRAGVTEEILFRGVFISLMKEKFGYIKSILFSSILFGISHWDSIFGSTTVLGSINRVISTFCAGIVFGYYFIVSKSLLGPIVAHTIYDVIVLMVYFQTDKLSNSAIHWISMSISFITMIITLIGLKLIYKDKEILIFRKKKNQVNLT